MAILLYSCLLILWCLKSPCAANINAFNYSQYQKQSWGDGTHMKIIDKNYEYWMPFIRVKWIYPVHTEKLPTNFDPREKWPWCVSLNDIYDQGPCGSCWVFGSVTAITDRICIASNGTKDFYASPEDALTCSGGNCQVGGTSHQVYLYWKNQGLVSGGAYNSGYGCKPYSIHPCINHVTGIPCHPSFYVDTPECTGYCDRDYGNTYENDREFASEVYRVEGEENIKTELFLNGPVTASMDVYEDFLTHKCGVYKYRLGKYWYGHVVKLMGWGEEDGVKYWLAANSWNVEWGERGFFKIARGENECGIESFVLAGIPKV